MERQEAEHTVQSEWKARQAQHKREEAEVHSKKVEKRKRKQENRKKAQLAHKTQRASETSTTATHSQQQRHDADERMEDSDADVKESGAPGSTKQHVTPQQDQQPTEAQHAEEKEVRKALDDKSTAGDDSSPSMTTTATLAGEAVR